MVVLCSCLQTAFAILMLMANIKSYQLGLSSKGPKWSAQNYCGYGKGCYCLIVIQIQLIVENDRQLIIFRCRPQNISAHFDQLPNFFLGSLQQVWNGNFLSEADTLLHIKLCYGDVVLYSISAPIYLLTIDLKIIPDD